MYGRPVVRPGSMAMLSRPRSHQSMTSTERSANWVGLVSARLSYSKIRPFFSATKILPLGANSMLVGWLRPLITICSWKPAGRTPPAACWAACWAQPGSPQLAPMGPRPGSSRAGSGRPAGPAWPGPGSRDGPIDVRPDGSWNQLQLAAGHGDTGASMHRYLHGRPPTGAGSMTRLVSRRSVHPGIPVLAMLGLLAGLILPGTSLAAAPSAPVVASPVVPSTPPSTPPAERPNVPEIFNPANPLVAKPALTGVLPAGFQEQIVINGLSQPTNIEFAPNGKIFVAEKNGLIFEYDSLADTSPTQFADLSVEVMDWWDRGLLSMAIDPGLTTGRPYIYVLYAFDAPIGGTAPPYGGTSLQDSCPTPPGANPPNIGCVISGRLSRLTVSGNGSGNTMVAGSEKVLINDWCQQYPSHSIGTVMMGPDGQLWVTGGEGAAFTTRDYGPVSYTHLRAHETDSY